MKKKDTHDAALEAACQLFKKKGLAGLSMRKIAKAIGVSAPALYRHFQNKQTLVFGVLEEGFDKFIQALAQAAGGCDAKERFFLCVRAYLEFAQKQPEYYRLMFGTSIKDFRPILKGFRLDSIPETLSKKGDAAFQILLDRIRECIDVGIFGQAELHSIALFVWSHAHGLASLRLSGQLQHYDAKAFSVEIEENLQRIIRGLAPRKEC